MKRIIQCLTLALVLVLGGCVPSLHPLYTNSDLVFEQAFLGEWARADPDSKETLTFTKRDESSYNLAQTEGPGKKTAYVAHLIRLDGNLFMDVGPDPSVECDCLCGPVHMFFFVSEVQPKLRISGLDPDWVAKFLKKNPSAINHEFVGEDLWLTAPSKKLQSFVLKHLNTKGAFSEPIDYVRKK